MYMNMGRCSMHAFICAVLGAVLLLAPRRIEAITCQDVATNLAPCTGYFLGGGLALPACCAGVRGLHDAAVASTPDRRTICSCLKRYALGMSGFNPAVARSLPAKCGVQVAHPIFASTDCSKV
ncbi:non-specific lipid-transfer protein 1-like [Nymphaea colorata]|uniref:non-specific lipid-transfer protein 1-like n=1 Tax=Nymphaea colorata TaxID=210225 RepID=UPI00129ED056|nr:non-specific lipid-transfer protein 1-like [Nymphaea colorata]